MLRLSEAQREHVNSRRKTLRAIIAAEPQKGLIRYYMELDTLNVITELHNIGMEEERKQKNDNS